MSDEKKWADMTPTERSAKMRAAKEAKAAARLEETHVAAREIVPDISDEDIERIRAEARAEVAAELKAQKLRALKQAALEEARREAGLAPSADEIDDAEQDRLSEEVMHTINLPVKEHSAWGSQYAGRPHIVLDGRIFFHGVPTRMTRAQYDTIRDIESQCWRHEAEIDGHRRNFYNQQRGVWQTAAGGSPTGSGAHAV